MPSERSPFASFVVSRWSLAGWGLAALLWVAVHAFDLPSRRERVTVLQPDQSAIENHILSHSRAAREGVPA